MLTDIANRVFPARLKAFPQAFRRSRTRTVRIAEIPLRVRTPTPHYQLTPDYQIAAPNLGDEFATVPSPLPTLEHDFIIAGGYIGTAAIALSRIYPEAKIAILEPAQSNYRLLLRNNRRFPNIVPLNRALAGAMQSATLRDRAQANADTRSS